MGSICVHSYISKKLPGNFGIQLKVEVSCEGIFYNEQAGRGQAGSAVAVVQGLKETVVFPPVKLTQTFLTIFSWQLGPGQVCEGGVREI